MRESRWIPGVLLSFFLAASWQSASAQEKWPQPPDKWWESVKVGDSATYEFEVNGRKMKAVFDVGKVEGSKITVTTTSWVGGPKPRKESKTINVSDPKMRPGQFGEGAVIKKIGTEKIKVGDREFDCTVYSVTKGSRVTKFWLCYDIPPVFMNSAVKLEITFPLKDKVYTTKIQLKKVGFGKGGGAD